MNIQYDTPFEVTEYQYRLLMSKCGGIVAGRIEDGRYYIKVWLMRYKKEVERILNA